MDPGSGSSWRNSRTVQSNDGKLCARRSYSPNVEQRCSKHHNNSLGRRNGVNPSLRLTIWRRQCPCASSATRILHVDRLGAGRTPGARALMKHANAGANAQSCTLVIACACAAGEGARCRVADRGIAGTVAAARAADALASFGVGGIRAGHAEWGCARARTGRAAIGYASIRGACSGWNLNHTPRTCSARRRPCPRSGNRCCPRTRRSCRTRHTREHWLGTRCRRRGR